MIVAPPRINLRRAASYTHDKGPLSSTSSRFGFNHLVFASPPPSPGLPQLIPPKRKASHTPRPSRVIRAVVYLAGAISVIYLVITAIWGGSGQGRSARDGLYIWPTDLRSDDSEFAYEMVAKSSLPGHPTPVIVSDSHGYPKWTVSIPPNYNFPLTVDDYAGICAKCVEVANRVDALRGYGGGGIGSISNLGGLGSSSSKKRKQKSSAERLHSFDSNFVDVHEAEVAGIFTGSVSISSLLSQQADDGDIVGESRSSVLGKPVCGRSLTFVLASSDAGLGRTLMLLWMAYAQAQSEGRGFFIDDTRWAYGRYTHIFAPPPAPNCRPPLRHEMLPCPRQARHLVMTIDTASQFFFTDKSDALAGIASDRAKHLFDLARQGYKALFRLNGDDAKHVTQRVTQLKAKTTIEKRSVDSGAGPGGYGNGHGKDEHGTIVGLHVRRGDRRPVEFQYRDSYVPLNLYADRASDAIATAAARQSRKSYRKSSQQASVSAATSHSLMVLASDDPMVYESDEFSGAARAQERIRLASKGVSEPQEPQPGSFRKFVDETFGWEGGFFAAMFWNLGGASPPPEMATPPPASAETQRIRSLVGRAYMMDLAVLAEASDTIVCAVSATGCRLLAVMIGWDAAVEQGRWINIDGEYGWWAVGF